MMRRLDCGFALGALAVLAWATTASAVYTPNPAGRWSPQRFFLAGDFQYNDKDLDPRGEINDEIGFFARPAFSLAKNIMIYGRIGFQDSDTLDSGFAAGFGVQGAYVFPNAPEWAVGGAFDFLWWDTEGEFGGDVDYTEFQFTPAVSYNVPQLPELTPYAGVMLDFLGGDLEEDDVFGLVFGTNYDLMDRIRFDAQFRVISETGFLLSAGYLF
jgi:hypothetical protein